MRETLDDELTPLAEAVSDGSAVDWEAETARRPHLEQVVGELRVLESLAAVYRAPRAPEDVTSTPAAHLEAPPQLVSTPTSIFNFGARMIGTHLSHYRLLEQIGAGGMGVVYRARDKHLDRDVAVKVLPTGVLADDSARQRFRREALALSKLNHPHIATIHDFDTQDGLDFLVMELVAGTPLDERIRQGPLPEAEVCALGAQIAEALEAAHEQGIVHRDLKPSNVALTAKGQVKVLDFGLARLLRPAEGIDLTRSLTETDVTVGTVPYMAPEQLLGRKADARADLYALGVVLYELATGRSPYREKVATALVY